MDTKSAKTLPKSTLLDAPQPGARLKASTVEAYENIYTRCMRRALEKREHNPDEPATITPMDLVDDWIASLGKNSLNTAHMQRSALIWVIANRRMEGWMEAYTKLKAMSQREVKDASVDVQKDTSRNTRAPGRMIPEGDLMVLINTLASMDTWGPPGQWFLLAGIASGARPIEWIDAEWIDEDNGVLRIYTAKVKSRNAWLSVPAMTFTAEDLEHEVDQLWDQRGARGVEGAPSWYEVDFARRIATLNLTDDELAELRGAQHKNGVTLFRDVAIEMQYRTHVKLHMKSIKNLLSAATAPDHPSAAKKLSREQVFEKYYYNPVRHCIWRACLKAFPDGRLYSLVDTRSTFSANRKADIGLEGASKELGHASPTTSRDFYAPASKAWTRYRNKPQTAAAKASHEAILQADTVGRAAPPDSS